MTELRPIIVDGGDRVVHTVEVVSGDVEVYDGDSEVFTDVYSIDDETPDHALRRRSKSHKRFNAVYDPLEIQPSSDYSRPKKMNDIFEEDLSGSEYDRLRVNLHGRNGLLMRLGGKFVSATARARNMPEPDADWNAPVHDGLPKHADFMAVSDVLAEVPDENLATFQLCAGPADIPQAAATKKVYQTLLTNFKRYAVTDDTVLGELRQQAAPEYGEQLQVDMPAVIDDNGTTVVFSLLKSEAGQTQLELRRVDDAGLPVGAAQVTVVRGVDGHTVIEPADRSKQASLGTEEYDELLQRTADEFDLYFRLLQQQTFD